MIAAIGFLLLSMVVGAAIAGPICWCVAMERGRREGRQAALQEYYTMEKVIKKEKDTSFEEELLKAAEKKEGTKEGGGSSGRESN